MYNVLNVCFRIDLFRCTAAAAAPETSYGALAFEKSPGATRHSRIILIKGRRTEHHDLGRQRSTVCRGKTKVHQPSVVYYYHIGHRPPWVGPRPRGVDRSTVG